jgi:outer membrane immunogenic protein
MQEGFNMGVGMKSSVLAAMIIVGAAGSAWAADISAPRPVGKAAVAPPPVTYNWTGFYIGGNVGYGWARATVDASFGGLTGSASEDLSGLIGGGLVGFNWQSGMFVGGIEADYQWSDQKNSQTILGVTFTDRITSFATVRGRAGVAIDNVYVYGTGGYAHFEFKSEASAGGFSVSETTNQGGWTVGAGIDVAVVGNLIARAEYLYLRSFDKNDNIGGVALTGHVTDNVVRGALMYKFGGGAPVRAAY